MDEQSSSEIRGLDSNDNKYGDESVDSSSDLNLSCSFHLLEATMATTTPIPWKIGW